MVIPFLIKTNIQQKRPIFLSSAAGSMGFGVKHREYQRFDRGIHDNSVKAEMGAKAVCEYLG